MQTNKYSVMDSKPRRGSLLPSTRVGAQNPETREGWPVQCSDSMVGSPRLGMMRILRSAGLVVMVLALIFFFEDIWALRNDVKVTIVREFKEHVLGEDLPTDSWDQSLGEHMTQMIPVEKSATPSRKHIPPFVGM